MTPLPQFLKDFALNRTRLRQGAAAWQALPAWAAPARGIAAAGARAMGEPAAIEDVRAALTAIPNSAPPLPRERGWDDWNRIGMAVWAASDGSAEGLAAFDAWGRKSRKWSEGAAEERWRAYAGCPPDSIGFGSLVFEARQAVPGWEVPSRMPREIKPELPNKVLNANGNHALPEQLTQEKSDNPLIKLNEKHAVIADIGGRCMVLSWVNSKVDETVKVPSFQTFKSFSERYANRYVKIDDEPKQLGAYWLKWTGRKSYESLDLVPGGPALLPGNALNLWTGFGVEPKAGHWDLMQEHIYHILASGDAELARYIFRFSAWAVQHPGERAEVALVFRGGKGSGKGTFANALRTIFGAHGLHIYNSKHLVGAFNGHLRNCLLLFADEAFWAGDKQGESVLKGMLTERELFIEGKGLEAVAWKNRLHVIMAANAEWAVPASHDERRYVVCNVSGDRIGDEKYFKALHGQMMNGGLAAMLKALQRVELGDWHPRKVVLTQALQEQKERSLTPIATWWEEFLQRGILPNVVPATSNRVAAGILLHLARENSTRPTDINPTALGRFLKGWKCVKIHQKDGNSWDFPELKELREGWENKYGRWNWSEKRDAWQR
jgi:Family of unknown function (DUF5906)/Primase C terminal 2 (PriCT-2)